MGVALGEEEPRRVRRCRWWAPSRAEPQDLLGLNLENSGTISQHLGSGVPCGAEAIVPAVRHDFALMGPGERPGGERGVPGGGCSREQMSWVLKDGGRNCEGGRPQQKGEVVVGACVPGGGSVVPAGASRWCKGRWGL